MNYTEFLGRKQLQIIDTIRTHLTIDTIATTFKAEHDNVLLRMAAQP